MMRHEGELPRSLPPHPAILVGDRDLARLRVTVARAAGAAPSAARLDAELGHAIVVPQRALPAEVVAIGSRALVEELASGQRLEVTIAWPEEAEPAAGRVSVLSPLGAAVLGAAAGDTVGADGIGGAPCALRIVAVEPAAGA